VLIAIGMRFDDRVTGTLETYAMQAKIIHLDIDPSEIDKNVKTDVAVVGDCKQSLAMLNQLVKKASHAEWQQSFDTLYQVEKEQVIDRTPSLRGPLLMGRWSTPCRGHKGDAVLVNDVGQNQMFSSRYFKFNKNVSIVTSGGLAPGLRTACCLWCRHRRSLAHVCLHGDGGSR
jgi:acetolactate synthase-1/2/3 large subunit